MGKELIELSEEGNNKLFQQIKEEIIFQLKHCTYSGHIDDIGNLVGIAVGRHIANKDVYCFQKIDFLSGFEHGYSLEDGTHG